MSSTPSCQAYAKLDCKEYIGIVSRQLPSSISLDRAEVTIITECPVDLPVGTYIVIESESKKYLARVLESTVQDIYALAKAPILSIFQELAVNVKTLPKVITAQLIAECSNGRCTAPVTPVQIHSLVRLPKPGEVSKMLELPESGVKIGNLALSNGQVLEGENVKLPELVLRHHVLVVGTTGSGKTVLLKNIVYEFLKEKLGKVLVLDTVCHFHHVVSSVVKSLCVIIPITTRKLADLVERVKSDINEGIVEVKLEDRESTVRSVVRDLVRNLVREYIDSTFRKFGIKVKVGKVKAKFQVKFEESERDGKPLINVYVKLRQITLLCTISDVDVKIVLIPWALEVHRVLMKLPRLSAVFTAQARIFYRRVIRELVREYAREKLKLSDEELKSATTIDILKKYNVRLIDLYNFLLSTKDTSYRGRKVVICDYIADKLGIHKNTVENMLRGILSLIETRLFDVYRKIALEVEDTELPNYEIHVKIVEPDYVKLFRESEYVVVDLRECTPMQQKLVVYRILAMLYSYVDKASMQDKVRNVLIVIDEAHTFFPQTREESEKELIESYLTLLARLGRAKGIGLIFATHSPDDLNDLVLQLTNTKIVLRSEEKILEKLGVPATERRILTLAPPGLAYVRSFVYKTPLLVKLDPPKTTHVG